MIITFGTRLYGAIERAGESGKAAHVATRFFHILFLPIFPLETQLVVGSDERGGSYRYIPARLSGRSVAAAYLRTWGVLGALAVVLGAIVSLADAIELGGGKDLVLSPLLVFGASAAMAAAFYSLGHLGADGRSERAAYARFVGAPVDVGYLAVGRKELRARLEMTLRERALGLGLLGYRGDEAGTDLTGLALSPAARDIELIDAALTLARLDETESDRTPESRTQLESRRAALVARRRELGGAVDPERAAA